MLAIRPTEKMNLEKDCGSGSLPRPQNKLVMMREDLRICKSEREMEREKSLRYRLCAGDTPRKKAIRLL